jgi:hypothetical protein
MAGTGTVKVRVREGWAVFDGHAQRGGGQTLDVDPDTAEQWLAAGWVEQVKPTGKR